MSANCFNHAVLLLSHREHSAHELTQKLAKKGYNEDTIGQTLKECQRLAYQCDKRYAEVYTRSVVERGHGPRRIKQHFAAHGLDDTLVDILPEEESFWLERAQAVWAKKFNKTGNNPKEIAKQKRFLYYRGFSSEVIHQVVVKQSLRNQSE